MRDGSRADVIAGFAVAIAIVGVFVGLFAWGFDLAAQHFAEVRARVRALESTTHSHAPPDHQPRYPPDWRPR